MEGIVTSQDAVFDKGEEEETSSTGNQRGDNPREEELLGHIPLDRIETLGGNGKSHDAPNNIVGSRDRKAKVGGNVEHDRCRKEGREHTEHEDIGLFSVQVDVNDLGSDGVGDGSTQEKGARKLKDGGTEDGLFQSEGLGGHRRGKGIGHIVGSNQKGIAVME